MIVRKLVMIASITSKNTYMRVKREGKLYAGIMRAHFANGTMY